MRSSAPPENMFTTPRIVPCWSLKNAATCCVSMPGTGMNVPMRYTINAPIRNARRLRISPKRVASPSAAAGFIAGLLAMGPRALPCSGSLDAAAGLLDGLKRTLGGAGAFQRHGLRQFARQHDLRLLGERADDAGLLQHGQVNDFGLDAVELGQAYFGARRLDGRAEAHLRQATLQRHLAALEADLVVAALARALTLHATAAGLALAGGSAASHAQLRTLRALGRLDGVQFHLLRLFDFQQVNRGVDHAAILRGVLHHHRVVETAQPQALDRRDDPLQLA